MFWRIARDKNSPEKRVEVLKYKYTLPSLMQLLEMLEIEAAIEEAMEKDAELESKKKGAK